MKKNNIILLGLLILAGGFFFYTLISSRNLKPELSGAVTETGQPDSRQTADIQKNSEGGVEVAIVPPDFASNGATWDFGVELTTHSGDLSEDLAQTSVLLDDNGKEYASIGWEGDPPGGHHRGGILKFEPINPMSASITLVIRNLRGVPEREFTWQRSHN